MKQVGYRRFHPATYSFKGPNGNFPKGYHQHMLNDSWPNNQGKKMARGGEKEKKKKGNKKNREGRGGLYPNKNLLSEISLHFKMFENGTFGS